MSFFDQVVFWLLNNGARATKEEEEAGGKRKSDPVSHIPRPRPATSLYRDSVISSGSASPPIISCCLQLASRKTQGEFTIDKCGITVDRCVPPVKRKACAWRTPVDWVCKKRKDHVFLIVPSNPVHHQMGPRANTQTNYSKQRNTGSRKEEARGKNKSDTVSHIPPPKTHTSTQ